MFGLFVDLVFIGVLTADRADKFISGFASPATVRLTNWGVTETVFEGTRAEAVAYLNSWRTEMVGRGFRLKAAD